MAHDRLALGEFDGLLELRFQFRDVLCGNSGRETIFTVRCQLPSFGHVRFDLLVDNRFHFDIVNGRLEATRSSAAAQIDLCPKVEDHVAARLHILALANFLPESTRRPVTRELRAYRGPARSLPQLPMMEALKEYAPNSVSGVARERILKSELMTAINLIASIG